MFDTFQNSIWDRDKRLLGKVIWGLITLRLILNNNCESKLTPKFQ